MPSNRTGKSKPAAPSSHCKANPKPLTLTSRKTPSYLVVDTTLPSHIVSDRSLFTTYVPSRKVHRTAFGSDIVIEGIGDVHVRVTVASGPSILFRLRDCWHVPASPHHFLSCPTVTSNGHQVIIAGRTPRMLFPHKRRLAEPKLPKYVPFKREDGFFVLKFEIPATVSVFPEPVTTGVQPAFQPSFSLQASSFQPFAALSFNSHSFSPSPLHQASLSQPVSPLFKPHYLSPPIPSPVSVFETSYSPLDPYMPVQQLPSHPPTPTPLPQHQFSLFDPHSLPNSSPISSVSHLHSSPVSFPSISLCSSVERSLFPIPISLSEHPP